jgi:hypothetical protein
MSQLRLREAGGLDPADDMHDIVGKMVGVVDTFDSSDIAYATYVFDYIQGFDKDPRIKRFGSALAEEYAERFAEWLGFVFLARANRTRRSKQMKEVEEGLGNWVESIPDIVLKAAKPEISNHVPPDSRFLNFDLLEKIGAKIIRTVYSDWGAAASGKMASVRTSYGLQDLDVSYNRLSKKYEIAGDRTTYRYKRKLFDLGFRWDRSRKVWVTEELDSDIIKAIPGAKKLRRPAPAPTPTRTPAPSVGTPEEIHDWFFDSWLPSNIDRFTTVFNGYGRAEGIPYEFKFTLSGREVIVDFKRNIDTIPEALAEIRSRYGTQADREGWLEAVDTYEMLKAARGGKSAMLAIDKANNLEHTHGAMMEHFPPGVKMWYPAFLDFKYTAHPRAMIQKIKSEDLRTICKELLPLSDRKERLVTPHTEHRTPKGLALEISSQRGKRKKLEVAKEIEARYPNLWPQVVDHLQGLPLPKGRQPVVGSRIRRIASQWIRKHL